MPPTRAPKNYSDFVCVDDFEQYALRVLPVNTKDYYKSGACAQETLANNKDAFRRLRIRPRLMRDISKRTLATRVLGQDVRIPIGVSPAAMQKLAHEDGEIGNANAIGEVGGIYILSTLSTTSIEDLAANTPNTTKWFQLYIYRDREITKNLVQRAERAGFKALVLTVDTNVFGTRYADIRNKFNMPSHLKLANFSGNLSQFNGGSDSSNLLAYVTSQLDETINWSHITWLKSITNLPIVLKGILTGEDAKIGVDMGAAAIIVSNHGGRQLDYVPASKTRRTELKNWTESNNQNSTIMKSYVVRKIGWKELKEQLLSKNRNEKIDELEDGNIRIQVRDEKCPTSTVATIENESIEFEFTNEPFKSGNANTTSANEDFEFFITNKTDGLQLMSCQTIPTVCTQNMTTASEKLIEQNKIKNYDRNEEKANILQTKTTKTQKSNDSQLLDKALLKRKFKKENGLCYKKTLIATTRQYHEGIGKEEEEVDEIIEPRDIDNDSGFSEAQNYRAIKKSKNCKIISGKGEEDDNDKVNYRKTSLQNITDQKPLPQQTKVHGRKKVRNVLESDDRGNSKSKGEDIQEENTEIIENGKDDVPEPKKETRVRQSLNLVLQAPLDNKSPDIEEIVDGHIDTDKGTHSLESNKRSFKHRKQKKRHPNDGSERFIKKPVKVLRRKFTASCSTENLKEVASYSEDHKVYTSDSREHIIHCKDSKLSDSSVTQISVGKKKHILKRPQLAKLIDLVKTLPEGVIIIKPGKYHSTESLNDALIGITPGKIKDESCGTTSGKAKTDVSRKEMFEEDITNTSLIGRRPFERTYNERMDAQNEKNKDEYRPNYVHEIENFHENSQNRHRKTIHPKASKNPNQDNMFYAKQSSQHLKYECTTKHEMRNLHGTADDIVENSQHILNTLQKHYNKKHRVHRIELDNDSTDHLQENVDTLNAKSNHLRELESLYPDRQTRKEIEHIQGKLYKLNTRNNQLKKLESLDPPRQTRKKIDHIQDKLDINAHTKRFEDFTNFDAIIPTRKEKSDTINAKGKLGIGCVKVLYDSTIKSTETKSSRFRPKFLRKNPVTTLFLKFRWITSTDRNGGENQQHCSCCPKRYQNQ